LIKPYIICHMLSSMDGRIDGNALDAVIAEGEYEATGAKLDGDAEAATIGGASASRARQVRYQAEKITRT
jgi:hypothetical protein